MTGPLERDTREMNDSVEISKTRRLTAVATQEPAPAFGHLQAVLGQFEPIELRDMESVALMDRVDTKYVLSQCRLVSLLEGLSRDYRVLEIDGRRLNRYRSLYFDTPDMALYLRHHAGNEVRQKIRSREYVDSGLSFFEVKRKTNRDRTIKQRLATPGLQVRLSEAIEDFLFQQFPLARPDLEPKLWSEFVRATFVSKSSRERLTLDIALGFAGWGRAISLPGVAVVEVKQDGFDRFSTVMRAMRSAGVPPRGISKYCLGVSLLYEGVKHNNFKPKLLLLQKIMKEAGYV
jgi:hypothetical protein